MNLGIPLKETIGDGLWGSFLHSLLSTSSFFWLMYERQTLQEPVDGAVCSWFVLSFTVCHPFEGNAAQREAVGYQDLLDTPGLLGPTETCGTAFCESHSGWTPARHVDPDCGKCNQSEAGETALFASKEGLEGEPGCRKPACCVGVFCGIRKVSCR